jgi:Uma2 family endonuclease
MTLLIKNEPVQERQLLPKRKYTVEEFEQLFAEAEHGDRLLELIHGEIVEKSQRKNMVLSPVMFLHLYTTL